MSFTVGVSVAVKKLNKRVPFMQPVFEAISNSLESGSENIAVNFLCSDKQLNLAEDDQLAPLKRIDGFTITDDGGGFDSNNTQAFTELWTKNKVALGCKGVGRLTWLKVYENIDIVSKTSSGLTEIKFTEHFDVLRDIKRDDKDSAKGSNFTKISFSGVRVEYFNEKQKLDLREIADIENIYNTIEKHLLLKLLLLKSEGKHFKITLTLNDVSKEISESSLPVLNIDTFLIKNLSGNDVEFSLYYGFFDNKQNKVYCYYCANGRTVKSFKKDIGLSGFQSDKAIIILLVSDYLDDNVNDERNGFYFDDVSSGDVSLDSDTIENALRPRVAALIKKQFPDITKKFNDVKEAAINETPYLADIINQEDAIFSSKETLIANARKRFEHLKQENKNSFINLLKEKNIDPEKFAQSISDLSQIALMELGEYILYRQNIIDGLRCAITNSEKKEKFIHDIFMPMGTADNSSENRPYQSNLWLLDDKFMTYSYAASNKTLRQIAEILIPNYATISADNKKKPDLAVFFNKDADGNAIFVEIKGANASDDEKNKSITELPNNIDSARRVLNIPKERPIWGYIITAIDEKFQRTIQNQGGYIRLFSDKEKGLAYYTFNGSENVNAHITILDLETIISDAADRNKTFLDILKKR